MTERFRISKTRQIRLAPWHVAYPTGFSECNTGMFCSSFADAVEHYIEAQQQQCPMCLQGAVVDTSWGWKCGACSSSDVAVGCTRP